MKLSKLLLIILLPVVTAASAGAELNIDGFLQSLYGGRIDKDNPTATEQTASENRLQLRLENFSDKGEVFGRIDFTYDGSATPEYDMEMREGYFKFRMGNNFDFKVGRQILTWGTGDLVFINDVFAKDYRSFFVGRDDQYLKAPQNALRMEYYSGLANFSLVWSPRFEPNRLPTGENLSYYLPPMPQSGGGFSQGQIVGTGLDEMYYFDPPLPEATFGNSEFALRAQRQLGAFNTALYFYKGFYKNPLGFDMAGSTPFFPRVQIYGLSFRGAVLGGVVWLEGGYYDSNQDPDGLDPFIPNSSLSTVFGFEKQIAANLTANIQWQTSHMFDYDIFTTQQIPGTFVRDETRHLLTSRITKLLKSETVTVSSFIFYSPTDDDLYWRFSTSYKYSDEINLTAGANIFDGDNMNTDFGQFALNDNIYAKLTYGF